MDMAVTSIVFLGGAIALGFWRKMNVGIISMGCAFLLGRLLLMPDKQILSGFDASLFVTLMGVTFLFSVLNENGTIKLLSSHIVQLIGSKAWLLPVTIFVVGYVLTAIGPGAIPMLAIMPAFAIPVARARGFNPLMLALIADFGVFAGRMSPITPEGILVRELINMAGVTAPLDTALIINQTLTGIVCGIMSWFSSGLGVVFPTLIPVVGEVANMVGGSVSPVELASLVVIGGTFTGVSPFSTTGALILATIMAEKQSAAVAAEANKVTTSTAKNNHVFLSLLVWSVITLVILALLAICGVYRLFV